MCFSSKYLQFKKIHKKVDTLHIFQLVVTCIVVLFVVGCVSTNNYKIAESLPKGDYSGGLSVSTVKVTPRNKDSVIIGPHLRYGLSDNVDLELKYIFGIVGNVKYTFPIEKEQVVNAFEIGVGGVNDYLYGDGIHNNFYVTYYHTRKLRHGNHLTLGPKVLVHNIMNDSPQMAFGGFLNYEIRIGHKLSIVPEVSIHYSPIKFSNDIVVTSGIALDIRK